VEEGKTALQIAGDLKAPIGLVHQQLAVALLLPMAPSPAKEEESVVDLGLDASQKEAAEHEGTPLLVEAGPGAGTTSILADALVVRTLKLAPGGSRRASFRGHLALLGCACIKVLSIVKNEGIPEAQAKRSASPSHKARLFCKRVHRRA
jgi:hypothetical protein